MTDLYLFWSHLLWLTSTFVNFVVELVTFSTSHVFGASFFFALFNGTPTSLFLSNVINIKDIRRSNKTNFPSHPQVFLCQVPITSNKSKISQSLSLALLSCPLCTFSSHVLGKMSEPHKPALLSCKGHLVPWDYCPSWPALSSQTCTLILHVSSCPLGLLSLVHYSVPTKLHSNLASVSLSLRIIVLSALFYPHKPALLSCP